jgi:hypothetical protein
LPEGANAADYVLNGKGEWILAADARIGALTYNEQVYSTVEEYIAAYIDGETQLLWEAL